MLAIQGFPPHLSYALIILLIFFTSLLPHRERERDLFSSALYVLAYPSSGILLHPRMFLSRPMCDRLEAGNWYSFSLSLFSFSLPPLPPIIPNSTLLTHIWDSQQGKQAHSFSGSLVPRQPFKESSQKGQNEAGLLLSSLYTNLSRHR